MGKTKSSCEITLHPTHYTRFINVGIGIGFAFDFLSKLSAKPVGRFGFERIVIIVIICCCSYSRLLSSSLHSSFTIHHSPFGLILFTSSEVVCYTDTAILGPTVLTRRPFGAHDHDHDADSATAR